MVRLLVLGGSWFYGRSVVDQALMAGWEVTTFRRGQSGQEPPGVRVVRGDRSNVADLARLARSGPWDAVLDTSGYVPVNTLAVARALEGLTERYLFASTVSVYRDWPREAVREESAVKDCAADADSADGNPGDPGPALYGAFKAGAERAVLETFGADRSVLLRLGVMLGPREYVGRTRWWCERMRRGGQVLAPGDPDRAIQPVDVRDAAAFTLRLVESRRNGIFNIAATRDDTFGDYLHACMAATRANADLVWVPDDFLTRHNVGQWVELPLWRPQRGTWAMDTTKARAEGLVTRPIGQTVADTWQWLSNDAERIDHFRAGKLGLAPDKEAAVLAAWNQHPSRGRLNRRQP